MWSLQGMRIQKGYADYSKANPPVEVNMIPQPRSLGRRCFLASPGNKKPRLWAGLFFQRRKVFNRLTERLGLRLPVFLSTFNVSKAVDSVRGAKRINSSC